MNTRQGGFSLKILSLPSQIEPKAFRDSVVRGVHNRRNVHSEPPASRDPDRSFVTVCLRGRHRQLLGGAGANQMQIREALATIARLISNNTKPEVSRATGC